MMLITKVAIPAILSMLFVSPVTAQGPHQPKVQPGPNEPDWLVLADRLYGLRMFDDLLNPVVTTAEATAELFRKAGPGDVIFEPILALGLEIPIHGGFYVRPKAVDFELWSYKHKTKASEIEAGNELIPPLKSGSIKTFDPSDATFGVWISNDQFHDRVYTEPARIKSENPRLAKQPYKAMIYPYKDKKTGKTVPNSYLIAWEYSTNDDFQDVVCRIDNVVLIRP